LGAIAFIIATQVPPYVNLPPVPRIVATLDQSQSRTEPIPPPLVLLRSLRWWLPLVGLGVALGHYIAWLQVEWGLNANYAFGPLIPIAAAVLVYLRLDRWQTPAALAQTCWLPLVACIFGVALVPLSLIVEVNPDWRLLMWGQAMLLGLMALTVLLSLGGWPWVRAALPILAVLALAIPWPTRGEQWVLSLLLETVSGRAADVFYLFGFDVIQRSNLLYVEGVALGVDEACSGIRSLQLTLVVIVFLCLWQPLSPLRTLGLVGGGLIVCLLGNLVRIVILGMIGVHHGLNSLESWHDAVGGVATGLILLGILGVRWLVASPSAQKHPPPSRFQRFEAERALAHRRVGSWPFAWTLTFLAVTLVPFAAVPLYYSAGNNDSDSRAYRLPLEWDPALPGFRSLPIPDSVTEQLRFSTADHFMIGEGNRWFLQGYSFFWEDGRISSFTAVHRPENCLPAIGYRMVDTLRPFALPIADRVVPIHRYIFEMQGRSFFVYHALWDTAHGQDAIQPAGVVDRLRPFLEREHFGARQALLFMVGGELNAEQANQILIGLLHHARRDRPSPDPSSRPGAP